MFKRIGRLASLLATLAWLGAPAYAQNACFRPEQARNLPFPVIVQAAPPRNDEDPAYRYYPASAAASMNISTLGRSQATRFGKYWFQWANRCDGERGRGACGWNPKGNVVIPAIRLADGREVRPFFSSFAAANGCTMAQAAYAVGYTRSEVDAIAQEAGIRFVPRPNDPQPLMTDGRLVDVCIQPDEKLPKAAAGIILDYEVQDRRTPQQTEEFLVKFARLVKAKDKQAILYTNPLDAPTQRWTGITRENAPRIAKAFDAITVVLWGRNKQRDLMWSADDQIRMLRDGGVPPSHILPVFELRLTSLEDARAVHRLVVDQKLAGVMLWRNYATRGDDCSEPTNRKIACLIYEQCQ